ncbi:head-closure protein [Vibrio phage 1.250.O._10N.261.55.E11]|nr:head-closure protein [Vibrio phage 1.250.O._10N.261.55.E11]
MANVKTTLSHSPLSGRIYWGKVNLETGIAVGNSRKDVTNAFLQCVEHKFPINYSQNMTVGGKHVSTIYNISSERKVIAFSPVDPDEIDGELYNKLTDLLGTRDFDEHGVCFGCRNDIKDLCECEKLSRKQTMIVALSKKETPTNG